MFEIVLAVFVILSRMFALIKNRLLPPMTVIQWQLFATFLLMCEIGVVDTRSMLDDYSNFTNVVGMQQVIADQNPMATTVDQKSSKLSAAQIVGIVLGVVVVVILIVGGAVLLAGKLKIIGTVEVPPGTLPHTIPIGQMTVMVPAENVESETGTSEGKSIGIEILEKSTPVGAQEKMSSSLDQEKMSSSLDQEKISSDVGQENISSDVGQSKKSMTIEQSKKSMMLDQSKKSMNIDQSKKSMMIDHPGKSPMSGQKMATSSSSKPEDEKDETDLAETGAPDDKTKGEKS